MSTEKNTGDKRGFILREGIMRRVVPRLKNVVRKLGQTEQKKPKK